MFVREARATTTRRRSPHASSARSSTTRVATTLLRGDVRDEERHEHEARSVAAHRPGPAASASCAVGKTKKDAEIVADVYEHTIQVMTDADDVGTYSPVSMGDLFDVEYWSLEQAKIKKEPRAPARASRSRSSPAPRPASGRRRRRSSSSSARTSSPATRDEPGARCRRCRDRRQEAVARSSRACADVDEGEVRDAAFTLAARTFGGLDIVVCNAGTAPQGRLDTAEGDEALRRSLEMNLLSHNHVARARRRDDARAGARRLPALQRQQERVQPGARASGPTRSRRPRSSRSCASTPSTSAASASAPTPSTPTASAPALRRRRRSSRARPRAASRSTSTSRSNLLTREVTAHDVAGAFALSRAGAGHHRLRRDGRRRQRGGLPALTRADFRADFHGSPLRGGP